MGSWVGWLFDWFVGYLVVIYSSSQSLTSCQNHTIKRQKSVAEHLSGYSDAQFYKQSHHNRSSHTLNTNPQKLIKLRGGHDRIFYIAWLCEKSRQTVGSTGSLSHHTGHLCGSDMALCVCVCVRARACFGSVGGGDDVFLTLSGSTYTNWQLCSEYL